MLLVIIILLQIGITLYLIKAWIAIPNFNDEKEPYTQVTVVIAFRNEAANLVALVKDLNALQYPVGLLDIILVNDHSEDQGMQLLESCTFIHPTTVLNLPEGEFGKKKAIKFGVQHASSALIVTTDADCHVLPSWVTVIANFYQETNANFIAAPVIIASDGSMWQDMQQIEFASIIGTSACLMENNKPVMSNAANMAFNRLIYNDFNQFLAPTVSGDDVFLMHHIHQQYPGAVRFLKSPKATVFTNAAPTFASFFEQRVRWAGKWTLYQDKFTKVMAILVWGIHLAIILALFYLPLPLFLTLYFLKAIVDFLLLANVLGNSSIKIKKKSFLILVVLYPFYVVIFGLISGHRKYNWKGRIVK